LTEESTPKLGNQPARPLLTDSSILVKYIKDNAVLVDKTDKIFDLLTGTGSTFFLSRPRRFGKSLLLDTIKNIAEGKRELFKGTHIDRKGAEYAWEPFPVIKISFSRFPHDPEECKYKLLSTLDTISQMKGLSTKPAKSVTDIENIIAQLSHRHAKSSVNDSLSDMSDMSDYPFNVVLLIDEYDFPLLGNLGNSVRLNELRTMFHEFYSTIKDCQNMLRFVFITGISKFSGLSVFSGMNNIYDISLDDNYCSICGFTEDEIKLNFNDHIISALSAMKERGSLDPDSTFKTFMYWLENWYNGYSWNEKTKIYNPYSVIYCLAKQRFGHYWYSSGTSLASHAYKRNSEGYIKIFSESVLTDEFKPVEDLSDLKFESFLFQTGYLTIKRIIETHGTNSSFVLKCPNNEIASAIAMDFGKLNSPFPGMESSIDKTFWSFIDAFEQSDEQECSRLLSALLGKLALPYQTPVESIYQFILYTLLSLRGVRARLEQPVGGGRADLVYASPSGFQTVVEIKRDRSKYIGNFPKLQDPPPPDATVPGFSEIPPAFKNTMDRLIAEAVSQILSRNYLHPFYLEKETRVCAVAVHGWSFSMFRFYEVDWNSRIIQAPVPKHRVENEDRDGD
jgi:hypothetical protein